jgi:hypothetical protein
MLSVIMLSVIILSVLVHSGFGEYWPYSFTVTEYLKVVGALKTLLAGVIQRFIALA